MRYAYMTPRFASPAILLLLMPELWTRGSRRPLTSPAPPFPIAVTCLHGPIRLEAPCLAAGRSAHGHHLSGGLRRAGVVEHHGGAVVV